MRQIKHIFPKHIDALDKTVKEEKKNIYISSGFQKELEMHKTKETVYFS